MDLAGILTRIRAGCLRCRGLRSAGLDAGPAAADDDDDDEECKLMPGPQTSPPTCLSRSRDSFSARSRSSRFMIFFSRVLDIAPARRDSSALLTRLRVCFVVGFYSVFFLIFLLFVFVFLRTPHTTNARLTGLAAPPSCARYLTIFASLSHALALFGSRGYKLPSWKTE